MLTPTQVHDVNQQVTIMLTLTQVHTVNQQVTIMLTLTQVHDVNQQVTIMLTLTQVHIGRLMTRACNAVTLCYRVILQHLTCDINTLW